MHRILLPVAAFIGVLGTTWGLLPPAEPTQFASHDEWSQRHQGVDNSDLLVLGNSVVGNGVDAEALEALLGVNVGLVWRDGAASAWWYLVLKNRLLSSPSPPSTLVLVFTDHLLTAPRHRVDGPWRSALMENATSHEPDLWRLAFSPHATASPGARWEAALSQRTWSATERIRPLNWENRLSVQRGVAQFIKGGLALLLGLDGPQAIDRATSTSFAVTTRSRNEGRSIWMSGVESTVDLDIEASFLPLLVQQLKDANVSLVLVRHKRRRDVISDRQPQILRTYMKSLDAWLADHDVPFVDFTQDHRLQEAHFVDNVHLTEEGRTLFTNMLGETLLEHGVVPSTDRP